MSKWFSLFVVATGILVEAAGAPVPRLEPDKWNTLEALKYHASGTYVLVAASENSTHCSPYKELLLAVEDKKVSFPARAFWWTPTFSATDRAHFSEVNLEPGSSLNLTTFQSGTLRRLSYNRDRNQILAEESLRFFLSQNRLQLEHTLREPREKRCVYALRSVDQFTRYGEAKIDAASKVMEGDLAYFEKAKDLDIEAFCRAVREDKFLGKAEAYQGFCSVKQTTEEQRTSLTRTLKIALSSLARLRLGLREPEKAYGETFASDRLYRTVDSRAVFGGYDLVDIFESTVTQATKKTRCEDQNFTQELCRRSGVAQAAHVINYHSSI